MQISGAPRFLSSGLIKSCRHVMVFTGGAAKDAVRIISLRSPRIVRAERVEILPVFVLCGARGKAILRQVQDE
jgi:uncharacterized DUF497 family protein